MAALPAFRFEPPDPLDLAVPGEADGMCHLRQLRRHPRRRTAVRLGTRLARSLPRRVRSASGARRRD
jgi:hypothetical protein